MLRTFSTRDPWPPTVAEAVEFATHWHGDQRRPAGEPYVEHLKEATAFLAHGAGVTSPDVLNAAVLHGVVEDPPCPLSTIESSFGPSVGTRVRGGTKSSDRAAYLSPLRAAPAE